MSAKNSGKDTARAGRVANSSQGQHHGPPHTPEPWHQKEANALASKHSRQMNELNKQNDKKLE